MGGVRACELAEEADALVLFASYCAAGLSSTEVPVLSLSGSEDGLSTPKKIAEHRDALPGSAEMVEIAGASHASFGDYGPQGGDGTATIDDAEMDTAVEEAVMELLGTIVGSGASWPVRASWPARVRFPAHLSDGHEGMWADARCSFGTAPSPATWEQVRADPIVDGLPVLVTSVLPASAKPLSDVPGHG